MLCACIDIGSNTTRVLVADVEDGGLREVLQRRAFTRLGKGLKGGETVITDGQIRVVPGAKVAVTTKS